MKIHKFRKNNLTVTFKVSYEFMDKGESILLQKIFLDLFYANENEFKIISNITFWHQTFC